MSLIKKYNYQTHSLLDIKQYLEESGYAVEFLVVEPERAKLHVVGTDVYVDFPIVDPVNKWILAQIRLENYPKKENYEESKKLYDKLGRKFGIKDGEEVVFIKDENKLNTLRKGGSI